MGPDNSWYIAYNRPHFRRHPAYVVAIAGNANNPPYMWIEENYAVNSVADFNQWVAGGISNPLHDQGRAQPADVLCPAGSIFGRYLVIGRLEHGEGRVHGTWSRWWPIPHPRPFTGELRHPPCSSKYRNWCAFVYPTACASPSNRDFADLFAATLPARRFSPGSEKGGYQVRNLILANALDIVRPTVAVFTTSSARDWVARPVARPTTVQGFLKEVGLHHGYPVIGNLTWAAEHPDDVQCKIDAKKAKNPELGTPVIPRIFGRVQCGVMMMIWAGCCFRLHDKMNSLY
ncbi:hypothetical protein F5I97DRAFT_2076735 [Phlebopus sp. FC_14]|nr:hypothetical protein F5I97DRAFT_2076735 [Phlebopus sp. FC_14]